MDHKHRWHADLGPGGVSIRCADFKCKAGLSLGTLEAYLNAAESFKLQDALQVICDLEHAAGVAVGDEYEALQDYVAELEG